MVATREGLSLWGGIYFFCRETFGWGVILVAFLGGFSGRFVHDSIIKALSAYTVATSFYHVNTGHILTILSFGFFLYVRLYKLVCFCAAGLLFTRRVVMTVRQVFPVYFYCFQKLL